MKKLLLKQFTAAYDENGWFVAVKNALRNLSAAQANWKPDGADNSIRETLAHLNYYNNAYLERFKGNDFVYEISTNDETFAGAGDDSDSAWQKELENFERIMDEWRARLASADEAKFSETVPNKNERLWHEALSDLILHNAHHGGQIVIIRKLQGSWDASKGVS